MKPLYQLYFVQGLRKSLVETSIYLHPFLSGNPYAVRIVGFKYLFFVSLPFLLMNSLIPLVVSFSKMSNQII